MARSQNGWTVVSSSGVDHLQVPGSQVKIHVRKDDAGFVLMYVASQFDQRVEDIDNARGALDDWGYARRPIRGGTVYSNHASATAIDLNAVKHPLGAMGTFTRSQQLEIDKILTECDGVVRWGGHYSRRKDEMHFEIVGSAAEVKRVAAKLRGKVNEEDEVTVKQGNNGPVVELIQKCLLNEAKVSPGGHTKSNPLPQYGADGDYGAETEGAVKDYQRAAGLTPTGEVDGVTMALLLRYEHLK